MSIAQLRTGSEVRNEEFVNRDLDTDGSISVHEESLYDIPRPTTSYCTFQGDIVLDDPPTPPPADLPTPPDALADAGVKVVTGSESTNSPTSPLISTVSSFFVKKPVIADFKIMKPEGGKGGAKTTRFMTPPEAPQKESWSAEAIDRLDILSDLNDEDLSFRFRNRASTFVNPANPQAKQSVYIDLGEYQTLLRHSGSGEEDGKAGAEDAGYSLPQPLGYGEDTMKAVQTVTQKFDSFKLRQLRVKSFREAGGVTSRRKSSASSGQGRRDSRTSNGGEQSERKLGLSGDNKSPSGATCGSPPPPPLETGTVSGLTEKELDRIEVFYHGQETEVYICRCLADVFLGASSKPSEETYHWVQTHTGVPVLLLNTGMGLRPRELVLLVAQRDSGLPLWQDKVNYLSKYHEDSPGVHSMKVSGSLSKAVQLRMIDVEAAKAFFDKYSEMTSDPDDPLWTISAEQGQGKDGHRIAKNKTKAQQKTKVQQRKRPLTKAEISQPCNSRQLTKIDLKDRNFRSAFNDILPALKVLVKSEGSDQTGEEEFRPRLPTR